MGRTHSPSDDAWLLLKLSSQDQALYDAEMQSLQRPDPDFDWGYRPSPTPQQLSTGPQMSLTDFDPNMMQALQPYEGLNLLQSHMLSPNIVNDWGEKGLSAIGNKLGALYEDMKLEEIMQASHVAEGKKPDTIWSDDRIKFTQPIRQAIELHRNELEGMWKDHIRELQLSPNDMSLEDYVNSAIDPSHWLSLSNLGEEAQQESKHIHTLLNKPYREQKTSHQTELGQHHPLLPQSFDDAWVEGSETNPMKVSRGIRQTTRPSSERVRFFDEQGNLMDVKPGENIRNKILTGGHVRVQSGANRAFESGSGGKRAIDTSTPGSFWTGRSLEDWTNMATDENPEEHQLYGGRFKPQDTMTQMRSPTEASEGLHEIYPMEHIPANQIYDPVSLVEGRGDAEIYNGKHNMNWGSYRDAADRLTKTPIPAISGGLDRKGKPLKIPIEKIKQMFFDTIYSEKSAPYSSMAAENAMNATLEDLSEIYGNELDIIHALPLFINGHQIQSYEHKKDPRKIFRGYIDYQEEPPIENQYNKWGKIMQNKLVEHFANELHVPKDVFVENLRANGQSHNFEDGKLGDLGAHVIRKIPMTRHLLNVVRDNGMNIHQPKAGLEMPMDEHHWPLGSKGTQLVNESLAPFGMIHYNKNHKIYDWLRNVGRSGQKTSKVRDPIYGRHGEEKLLQMPTNDELNALGHDVENWRRDYMDYFYDNHFPSEYPTSDAKMKEIENFKNNLREYRNIHGHEGVKKSMKVGVIR